MNSKKKKIIVTATIINFIIVGFIVAYIITSQSTHSKEEPLPTQTEEGQEYAYKALMGVESPAIHESILEVEVSDDEEQPEVGRIENPEIDNLEVNNIFNGAFDFFHLDETNVDIDKQYKETMKHNGTAIYAQELEKEIEDFITGTFSWDYRNEENKEKFLSFRVSYYSFDGEPMNALELYEQIHEKVKEQKLIVDVKFNDEINKVYIHPNGGYVIDKEIILIFNQSDEKHGINKGEEYKFNYRGVFDFRTPIESDLWYLWSDNELGVLTLSTDYIYND